MAAVPLHVRETALIELPSEEIAASQVGVVFSELNHPFPEPEQVPIPIDEIPVHPADFVIQAIRIVVAPLRAPGFIAGEAHRNAAGKHHERHAILDLTSSPR